MTPPLCICSPTCLSSLEAIKGVYSDTTRWFVPLVHNPRHSCVCYLHSKVFTLIRRDNLWYYVQIQYFSFICYLYQQVTASEVFSLIGRYRSGTSLPAFLFQLSPNLELNPLRCSHWWHLRIDSIDQQTSQALLQPVLAGIQRAYSGVTKQWIPFISF